RGEPAEAVAEFVRRVGAPEEIAQQVKRSPEMVALAPTLAYDSAVMDDRNGGVIPVDLARRVSQPTLVLVGSASPPFMLEVGRQLAELLPAGSMEVLPGQDHNADPAVVTPAVARFLVERTG
ncbi:MAG TPA: hypothetical protein VK401_04715, partial [Propionibacteriaceae bacterium]|nr:hypothetical protein [Propionibacteriaceae bacterium]